MKWSAQTPVQRVVFEPTGPNHLAFERGFGAAGVPFVKVNPGQDRRFAEARPPGCRDADAHRRDVGP